MTLKLSGDTTMAGRSGSEDIERIGHGGAVAREKSGQSHTGTAWDWNDDADNPYNWSTGRKWAQVAMISSFAFLA